MTAISVGRLGVTLRGRPIVEDISFTVAAGRVCAFAGVNGSGKTTTLRAMTDLLEHTGEATFDGCRYADLPRPSATVGVLFDGAEGHPRVSARNHLEMLCRAAGVGRSRVCSVLDEVGLSGAADRRMGEFSLGMRQRLGLAAALLSDPPILVLDEPANGLDPLGLHWLHQLLRRRADAGCAVLLSSHLLTQAESCADDVVLLHAGRVKQMGSLLDVVGGLRVRVSTDEPEALAGALHAAGAITTFDGDALIAEGVDARGVARLARDAGVLIHGLAEESASLDEAFRRVVDDVPLLEGVH